MRQLFLSNDEQKWLRFSVGKFVYFYLRVRNDEKRIFVLFCKTCKPLLLILHYIFYLHALLFWDEKNCYLFTRIYWIHNDFGMEKASVKPKKRSTSFNFNGRPKTKATKQNRCHNFDLNGFYSVGSFLSCSHSLPSQKKKNIYQFSTLLYSRYYVSLRHALFALPSKNELRKMKTFLSAVRSQGFNSQRNCNFHHFSTSMQQKKNCWIDKTDDNSI